MPALPQLLDGTPDSTCKRCRSKETNSDSPAWSIEIAPSEDTRDSEGQKGDSPTYVMYDNNNVFVDGIQEMAYQNHSRIVDYPRSKPVLASTMIVHIGFSAAAQVFASSGEEYQDGLRRETSWTFQILSWLYVFILIPFVLTPARGLRTPCGTLSFRQHWKDVVTAILIAFVLCVQLNIVYALWKRSQTYNSFIDDVNSCVVPDNSSYLAGMDYGTFLKLRESTFNEAYVATTASLIIISSVCLGFCLSLDFGNLAVAGMLSSVGVWHLLSYFTYHKQSDLPSQSAQILERDTLLMALADVVIAILLLMASFYSDRKRRHVFMAKHHVDIENEKLRHDLVEAASRLCNDDETMEERVSVLNVFGDTRNELAQAIHIPFADLTLKKVIASGPDTEIILAEYRRSQVAVKRIFRSNILTNALFHFKEEIEIHISLRHPNIVQFIGASWDSCVNICIVMEFMERNDVQSLLASELALTWTDPLLRMLTDVSLGLFYLHANKFIHRDLKCRNILCSTTFGCKVADFGRSRRFEEEGGVSFGGTPFWLAPEIIRGESHDHKVDCYSFGIVMVEFESRQIPYHDVGKDTMEKLLEIASGQLRPTIPKSCLPMRRQLISDCLNQDPFERPSMKEIMNRLQGECKRELAENNIDVDYRHVMRRASKGALVRQSRHKNLLIELENDSESL